MRCNPDKTDEEGRPAYLGDSPTGKDCDKWKDGKCTLIGKCCLQEEEY